MSPTQPDARAAGRGALALIVGQSAARVVTIAFVIVATRTVPPAQFGRYSTVAAVLVVAGFLSDFGTTSAITKVTSGGADTNVVLRDSMFACLLLGLAAYGAGCGVSLLLGHGGRVGVDFAIAGVCLPFDATLTSVNGALDGRGRSADRAVITVIRGTVGAALAIAIIASTGSIRLAMGGLAGGSLVAWVVGLWIADRTKVWDLRWRWDLRSGLPILRSAVPFALISGASVVIARIDVITLAALRSPAQTAAYDLALRAIEAALFPVYVFTGPTLFLFARRLGKDEVDGALGAFKLIMKVAFFFSLPLSAIVPILGPDVVLAVSGDSYRSAGTPLIILSAGLFVMYAVALEGMLLTALPRMRSVVGLIVGVDALAMVIQVPLIVWRGPEGAAIGLVAGQGTTAVLLAIFVKRVLGAWLPILPPARLVFAAVVAGVVALVLRSTSVALALGAATVTYLAVSLLVKGVTMQERSKFRDLLAR